MPRNFYVGNQRCALCRKRGHNRRNCPRVRTATEPFEDQLLRLIRARVNQALLNDSPSEKRALLRSLLWGAFTAGSRQP